MSEIITATEAKQLTRDSSKIIANNELSNIFDEIRAEAKRGELYYVYDKDLSIHALNRLTELGFSYDVLKSGKGVKISWS